MSLAETVDATPALLDEVEARAITTRIRQCVSVALVEIKKAYEGQAWIALGYPTWAGYCRDEFGEHIRLPRDERQAAVAELRQAGMSTRAIAAATGSSKNTITADLSQVGTPGDDDITDAEIVEPPTVTGLDGKRYPTARPERCPESDQDRQARMEIEWRRDALFMIDSVTNYLTPPRGDDEISAINDALLARVGEPLTADRILKLRRAETRLADLNRRFQ